MSTPEEREARLFKRWEQTLRLLAESEAAERQKAPEDHTVVSSQTTPEPPNEKT